jgi:hypothetical protein
MLFRGIILQITKSLIPEKYTANRTSPDPPTCEADQQNREIMGIMASSSSKQAMNKFILKVMPAGTRNSALTNASLTMHRD